MPLTEPDSEPLPLRVALGMLKGVGELGMDRGNLAVLFHTSDDWDTAENVNAAKDSVERREGIQSR